SDLFDEFYRANIARNDCFLSNCLGKCEEIAPCNVFTSSYDNQREKAIESLGDTDEIVVIVTGGFHTPGLAQRLEDRRISYVIITPNVTKDAGFSESVYKKDTRIQAKMLGSSLALLNLSENPISYKLWSIAEAELTNLVSQGLSPEVIVERMEALFENYADELKQQSGVKVGKVNISYTDNHFIFTRNRKSLKFKYIEEENRAELVSIDDLPVKLSYGKTEKAFFRKYRIPAWMKKYSFIYRLIQSWISVFFAPKYELYALVRALSAGEEAWQEFVDAHEFQKLVKSIGKKSLKISKVHMDKDQKAMYNYIYYHISEDKSIQLGYKTLLKQIATSSVRQEGENIVALSLYSEFTDSRQEFYKSIIKDFYNDKQNFRFAGGLQKISVISALIKDELSKQEIDASLLSKYKEELIEMTILEDLDLLGQGLLADAFILILDYEKDFKQIKIFKGILNEIAASDDKMARAFSMIALRNQRRRERTRGMVAIKDKVVAALSMITGEMPSAGLTEAIAELSANQSNKLSRHIKAFHRQINASHIRHGFAALMAGYENPLDAEFAELEGGDAVRHTLHNRKMVQSDRELLTLSVEQIKSVTLEELEDIAGRVRAAHDAFIALMLKKEKKRKPGRPSAKDREKRRKAIEEREIAREKYIQVLDELDNALETIDMGVYCIFHLREREGVNEFLNDLMTFCFGQFEVGGERITKEEVEQMVDIIRSSGNFDEAREKLYKSGFRWTEPGNKFYRIFSRKAEIEKPVKYDILKPVILKGGFSEDSVVIDIGCGNHNIAHQLVQDMRNADVPEENIPTFIGTDFAADPGIDDAKIRYIQQDAAEPGTVSIEGEGVADKILISAALHHMPEDVMMSILDEAYRLLKPGGELIIFEDVALYSRKPRFDGGGLAEQVRELYGEEKKVAYTIFDWHANHVMGGNTYVPITGNYHSESEWMDIFSEAGFEVHRKDHIGIYEGRFSALPHSIFVLKKAPEIINVPIGKLVVNAFNANPVRGPVYSAFTEAEKIVNTSSWVEANEPEVADVPLFYVPGNSLDYNDAKTREIIELGMNVIPVLPYSPERTNEGMGDLYNVDFKYNENDYTVQLMVGRVDPSDENSPVAAYFTYEYQDISEAELEGFYEQASFAVIKKIYDDHIVRSEFAKFGVSLNAEKSPIIATKAQELPPYYLGDLVLRESLLTRFIRSDIPAMQYIGTLVYSKAISKTGSVTRPRANSGASFNVSDKASFGNLREYIRLLGEMKANVLLVTELFDESGEMKDLSELGDYVEFANKFDIAVPFEYKWTGQSLEDVKKDIKKAIETYKLNGVRLDLSGYEGDIKSEWLEEIRDLIRNIPANPNVGEVLIVLLPDSQKRAFLGKHCKTIGFSVVKRYVIGMHAKIPAIEKGDCIEIVFPEAAVAEIREGDEADILAGTEQIFTSEAALVIWDFSLLYNGKEILPINENQGIMEMVKGFISGRIEQRPVTQEEHFQIGGRAAWSLSDKYINQIQERLSSDGRTLLTALLQRYIDIVETGSESDIINLVDNRYDFESPFVNSVLAADLAGWIGTDVIKDELANNSQIAGFLWTVMMRIKFNEFKAEYKEAHDQEFLGFNNANYDGFFAYLLLLAETRNIAVPELPVSMPDNMPESISKAREIWQLYYKRLNSLITAGESYERVNSELYAILNRHILSATSGTLTDVDAVAIIHLLMMFADKRRPDFGDIAGESGSQVGNLIFGTEELTGAG
ncbi:MAG: class I SAM-dependent methyltransferase, partial [Endomicrobiales bacterium]|nr:class I SAM-dependent methyltransferase [Endomicrobiales bacterium]